MQFTSIKIMIIIIIAISCFQVSFCQDHREVRKGGNRTYKFLRKFDTGKLPTKQNGLKNSFPEELGLLALTILIVNA